MSAARVLVIDDEESIRFTFSTFLADAGYSVRTASSYDEAVAALDSQEPDLVVADIILGGRTGIDLLAEIRSRGLGCPVVMVTGAPSVETASEAVRQGAFDYIPKPVRQDALLRVAGMALRQKAISEERERYRANLDAIFQSITDAIVMVDTEGRIMEANDAADRLYAIGSGQTGMKISEAMPGCKCIDLVAETLRTRMPAEANRFLCGKGEGRVASASTMPVTDTSGGRLKGAVLIVRDESEVAGLERDLGERRQLQGIIGRGTVMRGILDLIVDLADLDTTVLVTGESGTGKELVAEALHYQGRRRGRPLVRVNCSALSEGLLESELFGHMKGAFTGAVSDTQGKFKAADGGTVFLDEIGDISPAMQTKLLRVIERKEFERVGGTATISVDVRVIAATNRNLQQRVREGHFREDLYYRLNVMEITLPPLRERTEDIMLLVEHFVSKFNRKFRKRITGLSAEALDLFMTYHWPGNVRQMEHAVEHAFIRCRSELIGVFDLPPGLREESSAGAGLDAISVAAPADERERLINALQRSGWNKAKAARILNISRQTLYRKMLLYRIEPPSA